MTPRPRLHPWRAARAAAALVALSAAGLTSAGPVTSHLNPSSTWALAAAETCLGTSSAQRVRADSDLNGVDPNTLTLAQTEQAHAKLSTRAEQRRVSSRRTLPKTTIDVYVHVITTDDGEGGVSTKRVKEQIDVLNRAYAGKTSKSSRKTPFTFRLRDVDRTASSAWYSWTPPGNKSAGDDVAPKVALHRGGPDDLNIYTASLEQGLLGYATFPWDTALPRDGVVLLDRSLPGGPDKSYSKGDTATHEVGHWLGLLHTFQNGCKAPGDGVDDTPYQDDEKNIFSCDSKLDTCAEKGKDPVHNFMSYGDDKCLNRFTKGQVRLMSEAWQAYRAPGASV